MVLARDGAHALLDGLDGAGRRVGRDGRAEGAQTRDRDGRRAICAQGVRGGELGGGIGFLGVGLDGTAEGSGGGGGALPARSALRTACGALTGGLRSAGLRAGGSSGWMCWLGWLLSRLLPGLPAF